MKEMIGERLKALRVGVRLSQTKLAGILGTQQSSINRYEQGQAVPGPEMFVKYADYFDVSMDYLYCRTDEPRGKLYDYKPQALKEKMEQSEEMREFIEMCFDPQAPVNKRLKEALLRIMTEAMPHNGTRAICSQSAAAFIVRCCLKPFCG